MSAGSSHVLTFLCVLLQLLWTTEKETLFIIKNAGLFGTKAGEVYQVCSLNTPPSRHLSRATPHSSVSTVTNARPALHAAVRPSACRHTMLHKKTKQKNR